LQSYSAPEIKAFHWPCLLANVQSKEKFFAFSSILGAEAESAGGVAVEIGTVVVTGAEAATGTGGGIETEIETGTGIGTVIGVIDIGTGVEAEKGKCVFVVCCVCVCVWGGIGATPFLSSRHNVYPFIPFELLPCVLGIVVAAGTDLAQGATVC